MSGVCTAKWSLYAISGSLITTFEYWSCICINHFLHKEEKTHKKESAAKHWGLTSNSDTSARNKRTSKKKKVQQLEEWTKTEKTMLNIECSISVIKLFFGENKSSINGAHTITVPNLSRKTNKRVKPKQIWIKRLLGRLFITVWLQKRQHHQLLLCKH